MDAFVTRLDYLNDSGKVVLCRRGFLCRCVGSYALLGPGGCEEKQMAKKGKEEKEHAHNGT